MFADRSTKHPSDATDATPRKAKVNANSRRSANHNDLASKTFGPIQFLYRYFLYTQKWSVNLTPC